MEEKTNYGFEIELNGERLCRAGFDDQYYVLTCILNSLRRDFDKSEELFFSVGGLRSNSGQHVSWLYQNLKPGDKITVNVIDSDFDPPAYENPKISEEDERKNKTAYFYRLKEELKGYLDE